MRCWCGWRTESSCGECGVPYCGDELVIPVGSSRGLCIECLDWYLIIKCPV